MAYEYPTPAGMLWLTKVRGRWLLHFEGRRAGRWPSPDAAARAVATHRSGHPDWDTKRIDVPDDLLDWRPLGDSL